MSRRIALFLLLPAAFAFERLAYYGMRSVLALHLMRNLGQSYHGIGQIYSAMAIASVFTLLIGGALCVGLRPSIVLALGSIIGVVGYGLLSISSSVALVWAGVLVLSLGQGLLKPAAFALAASEQPLPREHLRSALFVLMYGATNLSALAGTSGSGAIASHAGESASFGVATGFAVVGVLLAAGTTAVDFLMKQSEAAEPGPSAGRAVAGGAILLGCAVPYYATMGLSSSYQLPLLRSGGVSMSSIATFYMLNPVTVLLATGVLFVVLIVLHFTRVKVSAVSGIGIGLAIYAAGATPLLLASTFPGGVFLAVGASAVVMAVGESLVGPLLLSRVIGDIPPRFAGLVAGTLLAVTYGVNWLSDVVANAWPVATSTLLALAVLACLLVGVTLLVLASAIRRRFYEPSAAESKGALPGW